VLCVGGFVCVCVCVRGGGRWLKKVPVYMRRLLWGHFD